MAGTIEQDQRIEAQHASGQLAARERLDILFDEGSFAELGPPGHGVVTATGTINGRPAFAFAQDVIDADGVITQVHAEKITALVDTAIATGAPIVGLHDSPGASLSDGLAGLAAHAAMMQRQALASGVVPQIALLFGQTAGAAALSPALADITFMLAPSALYVAGPGVIREATGELATAEALGGATLHATRTGLADAVFANEIEMLFAARDLLALLPQSADGQGPLIPTPDPWDRETPALDTLVPLDPETPYDMRELLRAIVDGRDPFELQSEHAGNLLCALGRIEGLTLGIVANQPQILGGTIDRAAARKAARFVRFCDSFGLPIVTIVDSPGFLPGIAEENGGIVRDAAALLAAYAQASVPRITIVTRRALGGAWAVLAPKPLGTRHCYAWPGAEIAAMSGEAAAARLFGLNEHQKRRDYAVRIADPQHAVAVGLVDAVIRPAATRATIARALRQSAGS
jgi:propionyl-CoA carboxylase beta chain